MLINNPPVPTEPAVDTTDTTDVTTIPGPATDIVDVTSIPGLVTETEENIFIPTTFTFTPTTTLEPPPGIDPPPPYIFIPPQISPPFIPAKCGKPPIPRVGIDPGEDPDNPVIPDQPTSRVVEQNILVYPAPVLPLTSPFLSKINFDTNITKKEPTPYSFEEEPEISSEIESESSTLETKQSLCDDEEDCDKLGF